MIPFLYWYNQWWLSVVERVIRTFVMLLLLGRGTYQTDKNSISSLSVFIASAVSFSLCYQRFDSQVDGWELNLILDMLESFGEVMEVLTWEHSLIFWLLWIVSSPFGCGVWCLGRMCLCVCDREEEEDCVVPLPNDKIYSMCCNLHSNNTD